MIGNSHVGTALGTSLVLALALGCRVQPPAGPVPMEGSRAQLDSLSGDWEGTYRTSNGVRHGVLRFSLRPGADTAHGEVEITFSRALRLYGDPPDEDLPRSPCRVIEIALVRIADSSIHGTLEPYWDPDCECRTVTVFEGRLSKPGRVEGTFTSRSGEAAPVRLTGRWAANRR